MQARFGAFVLDVETRRLLHGDQVCHLQPKAFELLRFLFDQRPKAVSKKEIHERLWPATFVSESNLTSLVAELRAALGDDARQPRFIRTVHGFGYAFCGTDLVVARPSPRAARRLRLYCDDREIVLREGENVIGRDDEAVACLESATVSRRHARIVVADGRAVLEDMGSKNGTYVGGARISAPHALEDGDEIRLGRARLTFRVLPAATSTKSGAES